MPMVGLGPPKWRLSWACRLASGAVSCVRRDALRAGLLVAVAALVSGCTIDGFGFAVSDVTRSRGAVVIGTQTIGAAFRTGPKDRGVAFGYTSTLLVLPERPDAPHPGRYLFGIPASGLSPAASLRRVVGIDLPMNRREIGVMVGYSEDISLADIDRGVSMARILVLTPDDPATISLRVWQAPPCE